jgi:hypothetical protein
VDFKDAKVSKSRVTEVSEWRGYPGEDTRSNFEKKGETCNGGEAILTKGRPPVESDAIHGREAAGDRLEARLYLKRDI